MLAYAHFTNHGLAIDGSVLCEKHNRDEYNLELALSAAAQDDDWDGLGRGPLNTEQDCIECVLDPGYVSEFDYDEDPITWTSSTEDEHDEDNSLGIDLPAPKPKIEWVTAAELGKFLGISTNAVYVRCDAGTLPHYRLSGENRDGIRMWNLATVKRVLELV